MRIRETYHWVPRGESVYLVMNNAGGMGLMMRRRGIRMSYLNGTL